MNLGLHKIVGISLVAEGVLISQAGLCPVSQSFACSVTEFHCRVSDTEALLIFASDDWDYLQNRFSKFKPNQTYNVDQNCKVYSFQLCTEKEL
jgi:hypothetical protein